jgi:hypothetical protein
VFADSSTELPGYKPIKITGDRPGLYGLQTGGSTGFSGLKTLSAGDNTGLYGWNTDGSTGLPVLKLVKKTNADSNYGFSRYS